MDHSWVKRSKKDVDLSYCVHECDRCGTALPASVDLEDADLTEFGISYDCDLQAVKSVIRS